MTNPPNNLQPAIQQVYADHRRIVKEKNRQINALQAEKGELQRALQERPETPSETLIERAEKAEEELREARIALSSWEYNMEQRLDHARREAAGELAGQLERTDMQLRVTRERVYIRQREAAEAIARAEKAEQERDEAKWWANRWQEAAEENEAEIDRLRNAQPRPLTADDITDEMADRFIAAYMAESGPLPGAIRAGLVAMHTPPPSRPEGAEDLETVIGLNAGQWTNGAEDVRELADLLASKGVRVTGGK